MIRSGEYLLSIDEFFEQNRKEFIEKSERYKREGINIGDVHVDTDCGIIVLYPYPNDCPYEVDISHMETAVDFMRSIDHLFGKNWLTPKMLGEIIFAAKEYWQFVKFGNKECRYIPIAHVLKLYAHQD